MFTLGVLAYELATASLPYDGGSMPELLGNMLRGQPPDPSPKQPTLPEGAARAILRALKPVSVDRYASVREFAKELLG